MTRRFQFSLRASLVTIMVVAAFFGGVHLERERQRREDEAAALAARTAERATALARARQRMAVLASEMDLQRQQIATEGEVRERTNRELFLQERTVDQLMSRFNALTDEARRRDDSGSAVPETD